MRAPSKKRKNRYFHYQKEILNTISEPASFINRNYRYVFVNSAFNTFYNKETSEIIGKTGADIFGKDDFESKIKPQLNNCLAGEPVFMQYEGELPGGEFKILKLNFYPHLKSTGKIDGIISTSTDITDQKRAENALRENEARLKELNATKDKLFSIIGHDLKGPLNNILGFSELIEEGYDKHSPEDIRHYNKLIYRLSLTVSELLENLLTWSRAQRQKISVTPQNIALSYIIAKCFSVLEQNAIKKQIRLKNSVPPETIIFADEEMITTVIRNLISNAIKFTNRGGTITISTKNKNKRVLIEISDTGIGISEHQLSHLFEPDENHTNLGTEGEKGTGLGLIICKDFIEKNNGKLSVSSKPGQGSVFSVSLPAKQQGTHKVQ